MRIIFEESLTVSRYCKCCALSSLPLSFVLNEIVYCLMRLTNNHIYLPN